MSRTYYYFIASLPRIEFDGRLPVSLPDFLKSCDNLLEEKDFKLIEEILNNEEPAVKITNKILEAWTHFNSRLINELAWFRAERAGKDPASHVRGEKSKDPHLTAMIHQISQEANLLASERFLDQVRWKFLEELSFGQYFNMEFLIIYALKLKILARYEEIYSDKGKEQFEELKKVKFSEEVFV